MSYPQRCHQTWPAAGKYPWPSRGGKKCWESHRTTDGGFSRKPRLITGGFIFDVRKRSEGIPWTPHMNHGGTWWNMVKQHGLLMFSVFFPLKQSIEGCYVWSRTCRPPGIIVFFSSRGRQIVAAWQKKQDFTSIFHLTKGAEKCCRRDNVFVDGQEHQNSMGMDTNRQALEVSGKLWFGSDQPQHVICCRFMTNPQWPIPLFWCHHPAISQHIISYQECRQVAEIDLADFFFLYYIEYRSSCRSDPTRSRFRVAGANHQQLRKGWWGSHPGWSLPLNPSEFDRVPSNKIGF